MLDDGLTEYVDYAKANREKKHKQSCAIGHAKRKAKRKHK